MTEQEVMPRICAGWKTRAEALGIKNGKKDQEAYMQGALTALVSAGVITQERFSQLAFVTAIGRLPEFVQEQAAKNDA